MEQIDFSAPFHRVNHEGILYMLCFVGIGGFVLSIMIPFLSNRSQHVMVDGYGSKLVTLCQECRSSVLGQLIILQYTLELFFHSGK